MPDLLDAYQRQTAEIRARLERVIRATWGALSNFRDVDVAAWEKRVIPIILAAERQSATVTDAYLTRAAGKAAPKALQLAKVTGDVLRGVPMDEVYHRPAVEVYTALSQGKGIDVAAQFGVARAMSLAMTDLQLAKTHAARASQQSRGVKYFRRTLTGRENCALCVIASTQRYHVGELSPIHPGCDCGVRDFVAHGDPGQVLDQDLLDATHGLVKHETGDTDYGARLIDGNGKVITLRDGSTRAADYTDLIVTRHHGEYGPTLAWRGQKFTGPAGLAA